MPMVENFPAFVFPIKIAKFNAASTTPTDASGKLRYVRPKSAAKWAAYFVVIPSTAPPKTALMHRTSDPSLKILNPASGSSLRHRKVHEAHAKANVRIEKFGASTAAILAADASWPNGAADTEDMVPSQIPSTNVLEVFRAVPEYSGAGD